MLLGCELSFALQNEKRYDEEREIPSISHDYSQKLMVAIMCYIAQAFVRGQGAVPMKDVREDLGISTRIANKLLSALVAAEMLNEVKCEEEDYDVAYAPAKDVATLKVSDLLSAVDSYAEERENSDILLQADVTKRAVAVVEQIKQSARLSEGNILIKDIVKNE